MVDTIYVKPSPANAAFRTLRHPNGATLVDATGNVPDAGKPWPYDGFTCRMLTDRAVLHADDPVFAAPFIAAPVDSVSPTPAPVADQGPEPVVEPASAAQ